MSQNTTGKQFRRESIGVLYFLSFCLWMLPLCMAFRAGVSLSGAEVAWIVGWIAISLITRRWTWFLYLFCCAFLLDQPGSHWSFYFDESSLIVLALEVRHGLLSRRTEDLFPGKFGTLWQVFVGFAVLTFVLELPLVLDFFQASGFRLHRLIRLCMLLPTDQGYQFVSAGHLLLALFVARSAAWYIIDQRGDRRYILSGFISGLFFAVLLGYGDLLGVLPLEVLRQTNEFVGLSAISRYHSVAGHPGWFAEYAMLLLPLGIWLSRFESGMRKYCAFFLVSLTVLAIVLTFQIGAWVALSGYVLWLLLTSSPDTRGDASRGILMKRIRVVVLCALVLISLMTVVLAIFGDARILQLIAKFRHRGLLWLDGIVFWVQHPLTGYGIGTFGVLYTLAVPRWAANFVLFHSTAHSTFLQMLVEMGLPGLFASIAFPGVVLLRLRELRKQAEPQDGQSLMYAISCSMVIFLCYSLTQNLFFMQPVQVMLWILLTLAATDRCTENENGKMSSPTKAIIVPRWMLVTSGLLILALFQHVVWGSRFDGFYQLERSGQGRLFRWSERSATVELPLDSQVIDCDYRVIAAQVQKAPVTVTFSLDGEDIATTRISHPRSHTLHYRITERGPHRLTIRVDRVFSPWLHDLSDDRRLLGIRIDHLSFNSMDNFWRIQEETLRSLKRYGHDDIVKFLKIRQASADTLP